MRHYAAFRKLGHNFCTRMYHLLYGILVKVEHVSEHTCSLAMKN